MQDTAAEHLLKIEQDIQEKLAKEKEAFNSKISKAKNEKERKKFI